MSDFLFNLSWMSINIFLAIIPVALSIVLKRKLQTYIRVLLLFFWILFLPNTIYLLTDIEYLPSQLLTSSLGFQILFIIQYTILMTLGIFTYFWSLAPLKTFLAHKKIARFEQDLSFIVLNLLISFALVLGKVERINSWDIFVQPLNTVNSILIVLSSPNTVLFMIIFGIITNFVFFGLRGKFRKITQDKKKVKKRGRGGGN